MSISEYAPPDGRYKDFDVRCPVHQLISVYNDVISIFRPNLRTLWTLGVNLVPFFLKLASTIMKLLKVTNQ